MALHHMITAGNRGYAAWRDGGFTIHDISDPGQPKLLSHINWSPPFPGGTHTPLPLPGRESRRRRRRSQRRKMREGHVSHLHRRHARAGEPGADLHAAHAGGTELLRSGRACSVRTTCTRTARAPSRARTPSSRPTTMPASACSTSRTRSRRRKSPPGCRPFRRKLIDPRPNVALAAKTRRCVRHDGWIDVCQRLERGHARAAVRRIVWTRGPYTSGSRPRRS